MASGGQRVQGAPDPAGGAQPRAWRPELLGEDALREQPGQRQQLLSQKEAAARW